MRSPSNGERVPVSTRGLLTPLSLGEGPGPGVGRGRRGHTGLVEGAGGFFRGGTTLPGSTTMVRFYTPTREETPPPVLYRPGKGFFPRFVPSTPPPERQDTERPREKSRSPTFTPSPGV